MCRKREIVGGLKCAIREGSRGDISGTALFVFLSFVCLPLCIFFLFLFASITSSNNTLPQETSTLLHSPLLHITHTAIYHESRRSQELKGAAHRYPLAHQGMSAQISFLFVSLTHVRVQAQASFLLLLSLSSSLRRTTNLCLFDPSVQQ